MHDTQGDTTKREPNHEQVSAGLDPFTYAKVVMSFATRLPERGVHRAGGGVSHIGEYVRVDVEGKVDVRVTHKLLDVLGRRSAPSPRSSCDPRCRCSGLKWCRCGRVPGHLATPCLVRPAHHRARGGREDDPEVLPSVREREPFFVLAYPMGL